MLLCTTTRVLQDLGFVPNNMPNITNAVVAALNFAEQQIASALGTQFAQQTITDTFFVQRPNMNQRGNVRTVFKLSQGFVNSAEPFQGLSIEKLASQFLYDSYINEEFHIVSTPETIDISAHLYPMRTTGDATGYEKGIVVDTDDFFYNRWVKITYQCGFPVSGSDDTSYDLTVVPQWLQTAAHLAARMTLQSNPSLEDPAIKLDTMYMQRQFDVIMSPHIRYAPEALLPDA